jgi:hypothetical protein
MLKHSLGPDLPPGLMFDSETLMLSGTPKTAGEYAYPMTYTATDADGDEDILTFTITVVADEAPSFGAAEEIGDQSYTQGSAISLELPEAMGGDGMLKYSLGPDLPPGLNFAAETRVLSGTPVTAGDYPYPMTYTATDADGDEDILTFTITVVADEVPSFGDTEIAPEPYTQGLAISLELPVATGGNGELSYTLEPEVPGLTFDLATRVLSGTPTEAGAYGMTYTVMDADGDEASPLTFTIAVVAADQMALK